MTQTVAPVLRFSYYPRFDKCNDEIFADVGYNHRYHQPYWQMLTQLRAVDAMPRNAMETKSDSINESYNGKCRS